MIQEAYAIDKSEGFWTEFFLLKCHPPGLVGLLRPLNGDDLLHLQVDMMDHSRRPRSNVLVQPQTRELFGRAVTYVRAGVGPQDEIAFDVSCYPLQFYPSLTVSVDIIHISS